MHACHWRLHRILRLPRKIRLAIGGDLRTGIRSRPQPDPKHVYSVLTLESDYPTSFPIRDNPASFGEADVVVVLHEPGDTQDWSGYRRALDLHLEAKAAVH